MSKLSDYIISFRGLKEGRSLFEYQIDASFYALFEDSLLTNSDIKAKIELTTSSALMILDFFIEGEAEVACDKCLEPFPVEVKNNNRIYVKFGEPGDESSDELIVLQADEHEYNIAQLIYEFICIGLPIRHVHPVDEDGEPTCDPEMLGRLEEYLVEEEDADEEEDTDPRWGDLEKLLGQIK